MEKNKEAESTIESDDRSIISARPNDKNSFMTEGKTKPLVFSMGTAGTKMRSKPTYVLSKRPLKKTLG